MMQLRDLFLPFFVILVLAIAGCGEINDDDSSSSNADSSTSASNEAATINLTSSLPAGSSLAQGGQATITAEVIDDNGNPVSDGTLVNFTSDRGTISATATTRNGIALATFQAGTAGGIVAVTAASGQATKTISFQVDSGSAATVNFVSASLQSIGVIGSGTPQVSILKFKVVDSSGNEVADGTPVTFSKNVLGGQESLSQTTASTVGGEVSVSLQSGTVSGTVTVIASIVTESGKTVSSEGRVTIVSGQPDAEHIGMAVEFFNIAGGKTFGLQDTISAYLGDRYGNVVPDGTSVSFISECGTIGSSEGFTTTTTFGVAKGILQSSNPTTPFLGGVGNLGNVGLCRVMAYTPGRESFTDVNGNGVFDSGIDTCRADLPEPFIDGNDNGQYDVGETYIDVNGDESFTSTDGVCQENTMIWASAQVLMSDFIDEILLTPTSFNISKGACQSFTLNFMDQQGNSLVSGTTLKVETTAGTLQGTTNIVKGDSLSTGSVYSFRLCSSLDATAQPQLAEVTVTISPPNGDSPQGNNGVAIFEKASGSINN